MKTTFFATMFVASFGFSSSASAAEVTFSLGSGQGFWTALPAARVNPRLAYQVRLPGGTEYVAVCENYNNNLRDFVPGKFVVDPDEKVDEQRLAKCLALENQLFGGQKSPAKSVARKVNDAELRPADVAHELDGLRKQFAKAVSESENLRDDLLQLAASNTKLVAEKEQLLAEVEKLREERKKLHEQQGRVSFDPDNAEIIRLTEENSELKKERDTALAAAKRKEQTEMVTIIGISALSALICALMSWFVWVWRGRKKLNPITTSADSARTPVVVEASEGAGVLQSQSSVSVEANPVLACSAMGRAELNNAITGVMGFLSELSNQRFHSVRTGDAVVIQTTVLDSDAFTSLCTEIESQVRQNMAWAGWVKEYRRSRQTNGHKTTRIFKIIFTPPIQLEVVKNPRADGPEYKEAREWIREQGYLSGT